MKKIIAELNDAGLIEYALELDNAVGANFFRKRSKSKRATPVRHWRMAHGKRVATAYSEEGKDPDFMKAMQWEISPKGTYAPCSRTCKNLPAGVYKVQSTMNGPILVPAKFNTDNLLRFEDPTHTEVVGEIDRFWSLKETYGRMGFLHNRAILMYGPPGSGKSCISKIVVGDVVARGNVAINVTDMYELVAGLQAFRAVEPDRQCLVLAEDIDSLGGESKLLSLLDGEDTVDNIMYLATTNYIDRLPERVLRPGRFDRKIEVAHPPRAGRVAYLQSKLGKDDPIVEALADETQGMSFAHLRELLVGMYCLGQSKDAVIKRLSLKGPEQLTPKEEMRVEKELAHAVTASTKKTVAAKTRKTKKARR